LHCIAEEQPKGNRNFRNKQTNKQTNKDKAQKIQYTMPSLADYEVLEKVGQGAQGTVYRAIQRSTQKVVALKQIDVTDMSTKERIAALAEVKVLASLAEDPHPCVVTYVESFVDQGLLCIALQWSANGTLQDALSARQEETSSTSNGSRKRAVPTQPPFEEYEVWNFFLSIALGLEHIHRHAVLHRDVKMANVFLHERNRKNENENDDGTNSTTPGMTMPPRVQLGDFGVSTILDDRSRARTMVGTPYYLSPELCMGKAYSQKSDVWSLGVILYVLLNQKMPFEASNYAALILRIVQEEHAKHTQLAMSRYSPALKRMATWCMQKDESRRPTTRELISHPDCLGMALRLQLPVPQDVIEAVCYKPPVVLTPSISAAQDSSTGKAPSMQHRSVGSHLKQQALQQQQQKPTSTTSVLPNRGTAVAPNGVRKKTRVVTGVANARPVMAPPHSTAGGGGSVGGGSRSYIPPRTTSGTRATAQPQQQLCPPIGSVPKPPRAAGAEAIRSVRLLPNSTNGGGDSSSEEEGNSKSQNPTTATAALSTDGQQQRKLYSYEKRLQSVERLQRLKEEAEESAYRAQQYQQSANNNGGGSGSPIASYERYVAHVHEQEEERRSGSRYGLRSSAGVAAGGISDNPAAAAVRPGASNNSDQTLVLLSRHNLLPESLKEDAEEALRRSNNTNNNNAQVNDVTRGVAVHAGAAPLWHIPSAAETLMLAQMQLTRLTGASSSTSSSLAEGDGLVQLARQQTPQNVQFANNDEHTKISSLFALQEELGAVNQRYRDVQTSASSIIEECISQSSHKHQQHLSHSSSGVRMSHSLAARMREAIQRASLTDQVEIDAAIASLLIEEEGEELRRRQEAEAYLQRHQEGNVEGDNDDIEEDVQYDDEDEDTEQQEEDDESSWLPSQHFAVSWRVPGEGGDEEQDDDDETTAAETTDLTPPPSSARGGWNSSSAHAHATAETNNNNNVTDTSHSAQKAKRKNNNAHDGNDTTRQLETFDTTHDIAAQANALFEEGERLLGTLAFAEVIEALTRSTPLNSQELSVFISDRVAASSDQSKDEKERSRLVQEVMYLTFRYVMLEGEKQRMRRGEDD
jgi:serine/threonine protein kinase